MEIGAEMAEFLINIAHDAVSSRYKGLNWEELLALPLIVTQVPKANEGGQAREDLKRRQRRRKDKLSQSDT